jgi:hypothetical protein
MSEEDNLTEEIRNRIWHSKPDLRASLQFLVLLKEKANQRTTETITIFGKKIREPDFFSVDDVKHTNQNLVLYKEEGVLKPKAIDWMEKYTISLETALSVASFAMTTMVQLRNQIAMENFHKQNRNHGGYKKSFEQLFNGSSPYSDAFELIMDTLDVYNQGISAKTIHKKKLKSLDTVSQQSFNIEKDKECVDPMKKVPATKKNSNPDKGPSDCCAFLPNMTLRLYVFISRRHTKSCGNDDKFQSFLRKIACKPIHLETKQLITRKMIQDLDNHLMEEIKYMEKENGISCKEFFLL